MNKDAIKYRNNSKIRRRNMSLCHKRKMIMKYPKKHRATLSRISHNMAKSLDWNFTLAEIDDVCASERYDLQSDLNSIMLGLLPRFHLKKNGHLKTLSIETILESQFIDSHLVRSILSEVNREWLKNKPLQMISRTSFGKNFQDKPPKRVYSTDRSVEKCQTSFKNDICECLIDFCQLLNSEDLYLFLTRDSCDVIVEKRFEKLRLELSKCIEKWCGNSKVYKQPKKMNKIENNENLSPNSKDNYKVTDIDDLSKGCTSNVPNIEQELDEIIQAQLFDIDLEHYLSPDRLKSDKGIAIYERNGKTEQTYAEEQASIQERLENEFDYFAKEIIELNSGEVQTSQETMKDKSTGISIYEDIDADIIMANTEEKSVHEVSAGERNLENVDEVKEGLNFGRRDIFVKDISIMNKNINRSLRKKKLDLDDYDDYEDVAQKKHKKRKEDKKHKKRKRNKHKNDSSEKIKSSKSSRNKNKLNEIEAESKIPKNFVPNFGLYLDSPISYTLDPYQNSSGLEMNFDPEFDILTTPKTGHENPLLQMLLNNYFSGSETFLHNFIPDVKQFCIEFVNSKNAFLWALMLTNIDVPFNEENKFYDEEFSIKKQQSKTTSNPLIQAFKQVVEANKKKEETDRKSTPFDMKKKIQPKHGVTKSKFNFKHPPGLSSLFKLQTNLKSTSRANIKEIMTEFQQKVFKLAKKENFINNKENISNSTFTEIDYSVTPAHFNQVSKILSVLYDEAEWKITNKIKLINFDRKFFNNAFAMQNSLYNPMIADPSMYYQMQPMTEVYTSNIYTTVSNPGACPPITKIATQSSSDLPSPASVTLKSSTSLSMAASINSTTNTSTSSKKSVATTTVTTSISGSPMTYSSFQYNHYAAMQYANIAWPYMNPMGYYMPDLSTIQAYHQQTIYNLPNTCQTSAEGSEFQTSNITPQAAAFETDSTYNAANVSSGKTTSSDINSADTKEGMASTGTTKKDANAISVEFDRQGKNTRFYVFKNESEVSKQVEKFLDISGLKKFDIHNLMLLRHLPNFECLVFVHKNDGCRVNEIPALLRLKRDLRVVFISYDILEDVIEKRYNVIFPRAGTVLLDENALVTCKSEVLESVCQFMKKQTFEKGTPWKLLITSRTFSILEKLKNEAQGNNSDECFRFNDMIQILQKFQTMNIVEQLTDQYYMADPRTTADYQACFVALQRERYISCRHFLFVTVHSHLHIVDNLSSNIGLLSFVPCESIMRIATSSYNKMYAIHSDVDSNMPRSYADSRMFLANGIDIMNIAEFMRCFVSKTIVHNPKLNEDHLTRTTPGKYIDAVISDCTQTITF
ncbi:hypothetical protein HELRODRAFT_167810 [Helobdella robusta]|uniref:Uncharacterized protein n=1 Tax=Helobdella robusta TaxID=6412 RepID=T1EZU1_HELRO|nr:hypothetical protein HELRODRAFT_167810 [Helobdella robusta]ESO09976.1 hypothetical protein HELRODRAFT_167810 [Helobdella robusta]